LRFIRDKLRFIADKSRYVRDKLRYVRDKLRFIRDKLRLLTHFPRPFPQKPLEMRRFGRKLADWARRGGASRRQPPAPAPVSGGNRGPLDGGRPQIVNPTP